MDDQNQSFEKVLKEIIEARKKNCKKTRITLEEKRVGSVHYQCNHDDDDVLDNHFWTFQDAIDIYLAEVEQNEALPLFKRRSLHL